MADHVHLLISLKSTHTLAGIMQGLKSDSSIWIKETIGHSAFAWQKGYGAFTVGSPELEKVREYVLNQEERHRTKPFYDEYLSNIVCRSIRKPEAALARSELSSPSS